MITKLDLYIFKKFIIRILFLLIAISSIILLTNFVEMIDNFIDANMSSKEIINYYLLTIPMLISYAIPMSVTIGTVLTILSHVKNNELLAIRSLGIGYIRISVIMCCSALIISFGHFYFENSVVSNSNHLRNKIMKKYNLKKNKTKLRNFIEDLGQNKSIIIMNYNNKQKIATNITIKEIDKKNQVLSRMDAEHMKWDEQKKTWYFEQINIRTWNSEVLQSQRIIKDSSIELANINPVYLITEFILPEEMDYFELKKFIQLKKQSASNTNKWEVGLFHKTSYPFSNLVLAIFAIVSAIGLKNSNVSYGIGLSLLIIVIYYVLIVIGKNLGVEGIISPLLSAWMANISIILMTFYYYKKYIF
tara:strand:+ start:32 stop:1114 length:1083 start_codon:yes stop_codon:yes gene_type:complete